MTCAPKADTDLPMAVHAIIAIEPPFASHVVARIPLFTRQDTQYHDLLWSVNNRCDPKNGPS
jgi:hypothetical protein